MLNKKNTQTLKIVTEYRILPDGASIDFNNLNNLTLKLHAYNEMEKHMTIIITGVKHLCS